MDAMDTVVNKWKTLIGGVEFLDSSNLARKLLTANELIFAEYLVVFTRVGSVKFSPAMRGDIG